MDATRAAIDEDFNRRMDRFHPLEIFPFFRRWECGPVRDVLYTFIWNCGIGLFFGVMGYIFSPNMSWARLVYYLLIANAIGYTLHAIFMVTTALGIDRWVRGAGGVVMALYYTAVCTFGVVVGMLVVTLALDSVQPRWLLQPRWLSAMWLSSLLISSVIAVVFFARERQARAEAQLAGEREQKERAEREAALANLRALQAQIEPHFLFNTLANVTSLVDADPAKAKRMLESFNRFLRSSLAATRTESTTLGAEAALIAAYLEVLQVRMGPRLRYRVEVPPELCAVALPPMLLQPVVENAIQHGLEPKVEGGEVRVQASRREGAVDIEVADTGVGFAPTTRGGLGLQNLRDRLRALYGGRGALSVAENPGGGTRVTVTLPA